MPKPSIRKAAERLGFTYEGCFRQAVNIKVGPVIQTVVHH